MRDVVGGLDVEFRFRKFAFQQLASKEGDQHAGEWQHDVRRQDVEQFRKVCT
ncbi:hypothetical protein [Nitrospira sp. M1]